MTVSGNSDTLQLQTWDPQTAQPGVSTQIDQSTEAHLSRIPSIVVLVSTVIALFLLVRVWKSGVSFIDRLFWTVFLFFPVIGPLFFLMFFPGSTKFDAKSVNIAASVNGTEIGGRIGR